MPRDEAQEATESFLESMRASPIALVPDLANAQHYEVPPAFYRLALGPALKYSCGYWTPGADLAASEAEALRRTAEHAQLADGQRVLELGCGWGSLSLYMARNYPNSRILAVSNSAGQRAYITGVAAAEGLKNLEVRTADMNDFHPEGPFDRVVSVEMFEHIRNQEALVGRVAESLVSGGKLFIHIFCSGGPPYAYEDDGEADWMTRHFFSGGMMPSDDLPARWRTPLRLERQWRWSGTHYAKTSNAWLSTLDARRSEAEAVLREAGDPNPLVAVQRWRMFFMACAELFDFDGGDTWWVSHYRFGA